MLLIYIFMIQTGALYVEDRGDWRNDVIEETKPFNQFLNFEDDPNYPTDAIEKAVAKAPAEVVDWLRKGATKTRTKRDVSNDPSGQEYQHRLCEAQSSQHRLRRARTSTNPEDFNLYHIVNLPDLVQTVTMIRCKHGSTANGHGKSPELSLYEVDHWCKQEYVEIPLVAVMVGTSNITVEEFMFPHGCTCYVRGSYKK